MSMARGIADGMLEANLDSARRANSSVQADLSSAEGARHRAVMRSAEAEGRAARYEEEAAQYKQWFAKNWATASAGLVVINAFIQFMETLPPMERERMRQFVAKQAGDRMRELDNQPEVRGDQTYLPSIQKAFGERKVQNDYLKVV